MLESQHDACDYFYDRIYLAEFESIESISKVRKYPNHVNFPNIYRSQQISPPEYLSCDRRNTDFHEHRQFD